MKELKDGEVVRARSVAQDKLKETLLLTQGKWQCSYNTKCVCAYVCLFVRLLLATFDNHILRIYLCIVKLKEVKSRTKPYKESKRERKERKKVNERKSNLVELCL